MRVAMDDDDLTGQIKAADPSKGAWSPDQMLLASIIDELRSLQYVTVAMKAGKKAGDPPEPMPRPGVAKKGTRRRSRLRDDQRQFFESLGGGLRLVQPGETASEEPQGA